MHEAIWEIGIWLGGFLVFIVVIFLALKVLEIVDTLMKSNKKQDTKFWIFTFLKYFPFFIIIIPIINLILNIMVDAEGINDITISSMAYHQLIVEQAPLIAGFIIAWTIIYILTLVAFEGSEVKA